MRQRVWILAVIAIVLNSFSADIGFAVPQADGSKQAQQERQERRVVPRRTGAKKLGTLAFARTELYFGTAKPGGAVTDAEFRAFVDEEVTPRFPDGLTLRKVDGQFLGADGTMIKEDSYILILLYPIATQKENNLNIETIRRLYMTQHQQESVLRVDDPLLVWVSF